MSQLNLTVMASDDVMVLPRILQVLSRRGYRLRELQTDLGSNQVTYRCRVEGDERWQPQLADLIAKLSDVREVTYE